MELDLNDRAVYDFMNETRVFPNAAVLTTDRVKAAEADSSYPFRKELGEGNYADYKVTKVEGENITFAVSVNGADEQTTTLNRNDLMGMDVAEKALQSLNIDVTHIQEKAQAYEEKPKSTSDVKALGVSKAALNRDKCDGEMFQYRHHYYEKGRPRYFDYDINVNPVDDKKLDVYMAEDWVESDVTVSHYELSREAMKGRDVGKTLEDFARPAPTAEYVRSNDKKTAQKSTQKIEKE